QRLPCPGASPRERTVQEWLQLPVVLDSPQDGRESGILDQMRPPRQLADLPPAFLSGPGRAHEQPLAVPAPEETALSRSGAGQRPLHLRVRLTPQPAPGHLD